MRNINELIGIIKGISFDGIINGKEIQRIQTWINKNRNLAYESKEVELIKLIDTVLEEHITDDDLKDMLLSYCDKFLTSISDVKANIYELNGIIDGIICDGEVNEQEVFQLKEWMDENEDVARGHKSSISLYKIISSILDDGVVTEEEQKQLLPILSARISGSQVETKLEYLKKQVRERKNIGIDLIDLLDNEEAMVEIHSLAEFQLRIALNSYTGSFKDQEVVFISLVLIAMLYYDGNYYESVRLIYEKLYCDYSEQKIEGLIRSILNMYRTDVEEKSRIINVALSNAIVPGPFLKSFFEFIYDIYKLNFDYNLSEDLAGDFQFVYEGLRTNMASDGDDVKLNVTKKTYKLIKSTKQLIAKEKYIDAIIKLSIIIVKLIDKRIWNKETKIFNIYLKNGYDGWIASFKGEKEATHHHRAKSEFRSRWEPKFILSQNNVYIDPPTHRVKAKYGYSSIYIIVKNGDEQIHIDRLPDIREIIGGYQINASKIKIKNPLGKITYQLLAGKEVIYDSKDKLHRRFIIFNHDGEEIENNTDYIGTAIFCLDSANIQYKPYYIESSFMLVSENIRLGATYNIDNTIFNFSSLEKPGLIGEEWVNHYIMNSDSDERLAVFKQIKVLVFEDDMNNSKFEIMIDGRRCNLDDFSYSKTEREGIVKYVVKLDIVDSGVHSIEVHSISYGKKTKIYASKYALDSNLNAECVKIFDDTYMVTVTSCLFTSAVNKEIVIAGYQEDWLKFESDGKEYSYLIPFEFDIYRVNAMPWKPTCEEMWIGNIGHDSVLDIYGSEVDELQVYTSTGQAIDNIVKLKRKGVYQQVSIGFLVSYKMSYDYVLLVFLKNESQKNVIMCYNKTVLDINRTELSYDQTTKSLNILPVIYGEGSVYFDITDRNGNLVFRSPFIKKDVVETTPSLASFENFNITFYEKEIGLSLKKVRVLKIYERIFYEREGFVGRTFKISDVFYDQNVRGRFTRKQHSLNNTYLFFKKLASENTYIGEIYVRTLRGSFTLYNINPVDIEICSDVIGGTIELSMTKDGDGLLLDFGHHGVMNTMDDKSAIDIFSYTLDLNREERFE